jgi:hypothetical protein
MFLLNNVKVHPDVQRTIGDVQYPRGWFSHDAEARAKVGMIEVPDIPRPDDDLFTSIENPDGSYTATPRRAEDIAARLEASLADQRASMRCSRMQGILALGEARWGAVLEYRATSSWAEQIVIDDAGDWSRNSENIQFFGYLLNMTDTEIDNIFRNAADITA